MLTSLNISNFKRFGEVEIELGQTVVLVGPNNSGKTTVLQALMLWAAGIRDVFDWQNAVLQGYKATINRLDLTSVPVPAIESLWKNLRTENGKSVPLKVSVSGINQPSGEQSASRWSISLIFTYANPESIDCLLESDEIGSMDVFSVPPIVMLPPLSGLALQEDRLERGSIQRRIGEGRTAEVLRNLCYQLYAANGEKDLWDKLVAQMKTLFGVDVLPPDYLASRGEIRMSYREANGIILDLSAAGRGMLQILLLLAYVYNNPGAVLLLDEPDAHLEILRQRQVYQLLTDVAREQNAQIIAASHSEVILNEAADRDMVISLVGQPRRIDNNERSQLAKALKEIDPADYYQAEQTGWVLYLEGSTDLAILRAFAQQLQHAAVEALAKPFVHYLHSNKPSKAQSHFQGLSVAMPDLVGLALFDRIPQGKLHSGTGLIELAWQRREIENYLLQPDTLMRYAESNWGDGGQKAMKTAIAEVENALVVLRKPGIWSPDIKASEEVFEPLFERFFQQLNLPNLLRKSDYHILAQFIPVELIDPEVIEKLDAIVEVARRAKPRED
jgi:predicted ATPase